MLFSNQNLNVSLFTSFIHDMHLQHDTITFSCCSFIFKFSYRLSAAVAQRDRPAWQLVETPEKAWSPHTFSNYQYKFLFVAYVIVQVQSNANCITPECAVFLSKEKQFANVPTSALVYSLNIMYIV